MLETNIQEKLNTTVIPEVGTPSSEVPVFSSEITVTKDIAKPAIEPVSSIQNEIPIEPETSVTSKRLVKQISVDSGTSWKNVIDSKEQGVEPSEL